MKKNKIIYRTSTGIIAAVMTYSIISFTFYDHAIYPEGAFQHLHLPAWFKAELTIAKVLGVLAMLIPAIPFKIKEFAYFGFAITLVSAVIAHAATGDKFYNMMDPMIFLCILIVSYLYFLKLRTPARQHPENPPYFPARQAL